MKSQDQKIESIKKYANQLSEKEVNLIFDIINLPSFPNKKDLFNLSGAEKNWSKIDSAYPIDYYKSIEEIYPNIKNANLCYDYNSNTYGEMLNINDLIVNRILDLKR